MTRISHKKNSFVFEYANDNIAKISLTSPIDINVPTRVLLTAVETKSSFVLMAGTFE